MRYTRMPIEVESPEEGGGYQNIRSNLVESSIADRSLSQLNLSIPDLKLQYTGHRGGERLRQLVVGEEPTLNPENVLITTGTAGARKKPKHPLVTEMSGRAHAYHATAILDLDTRGPGPAWSWLLSVQSAQSSVPRELSRIRRLHWLGVPGSTLQDDVWQIDSGVDWLLKKPWELCSRR
ncbi:hypothetical protein AbraIFM66950_004776 [Aspergillus brasiliensis]|nr:hypothetical protein AbraIFM66950_004776 [Aspergillus brasiliensis]